MQHILCTAGLLYHISNLQYTRAPVSISMYVPSLVQRARLFSDLRVVLRWTLIFCSQTASRRRKRGEAFLHSGNPVADSDSWQSTTNLVWGIVREKREKLLPILSLLLFSLNSRINYQWEGELGLLVVGPILFFWCAHLMVSDLNYRGLIRVGLLCTLTQLWAARTDFLNIMEQMQLWFFTAMKRGNDCVFWRHSGKFLNPPLTCFLALHSTLLI